MDASEMKKSATKGSRRNSEITVALNPSFVAPQKHTASSHSHERNPKTPIRVPEVKQ
jgi:hypothetical protein